MRQMAEPDEFRRATISQVEAGVGHLLETSVRAEAADAVLSFGLYLVDLGRAFALDPVFAAIDQLRLDAGLREVDEGWYSMLKGLEDFHHGQLEQARRRFDQALSVGSALNNENLLANGLQNLGLVAWLKGSLEEAEKDFIASNERRSETDAEGSAKVLVNLASLYLDLGATDRFARIVSQLAASPAMALRGADRSALLGLQGLLAVQEGRLPDAERLLRAGSLMARRKGIVDHEIVNLQNLGSVRMDLETPGRALRPLRRAAGLAWLTDNVRMLEPAERTLATALVRAGRFREAVEILAEADSEARDRNDDLSRARIAADLGALYLIWKKPAVAAETLHGALETFIRTRERVWGRKSALNLGLALVRTTSVEEAQRVIGDAAFRLFEDSADVGEILETFADIILGECPGPDCARAYWAAVEEYTKKQSPELGDHLAEIAGKLADAGMPGEAVGFFDDALRRYDPEGCHIAPYQILNDRGLAKAAAGDPGAGITDLRQSLTLATDSQDRAMRTLCLGNISEMTRRQGSLDEALALANQALTEARNLQSQMQICSALATLGLAQLGVDDSEGAAYSFKESLRVARRTGDQSIEAVALGGLGQVAFAKRRYRKAVDYYLRAVDIESEETDPTHETETWAALSETAARLADGDRFESYLQHLIDAVQKRRGPLEPALGAMQRAGTAWLEAGDLEVAGGAFAMGILLAAVESVTADQEQFIAAVSRAVLVPFFAAASTGRDSAELERYIRAELRRHLGRSGRTIESLFPIARDAVAASHRSPA
jgi:tetratricopeptide (TPR) repeat protein